MNQKPFKKIAFAFAFSPRLEANISEAIRFSRLFNSELVLIHVGDKTIDKENRLNDILNDNNGNSIASIIWEKGEPVAIIEKICKEQEVDLLIAGVLLDENFYQYYVSSIAKKLSRKLSCSILLLTKPSIEGRPYDRLVVNTLNHPKTPRTVTVAGFASNSLAVKELYMVDEIEPKNVKKIVDDKTLVEAKKERAEITKNETKRMESLCNEIDLDNNTKIKTNCVFGEKGYSIGHFAQTIKADLLVVNSADKKPGVLDKLFVNNLEYILSDLPCDLLIIN